ncbi:MAG: hypothetical protein ACE3NC_04220 [Candidatus Wallacebacter cryptica]|nr:hypothetical protein [Bacillota bacterium]
MGYEDSLRQARELLISEINHLKDELAKKEQHLRKLDSFLREPYTSGRNGTSLTKSVVEIVYRLVKAENEPITAKAVVKEFFKHRQDVNESTIRSTLYQVSRKQKPTEIEVEGSVIAVEIIKDGPTYDVAVVSEAEPSFKEAHA